MILVTMDRGMAAGTPSPLKKGFLILMTDSPGAQQRIINLLAKDGSPLGRDLRVLFILDAWLGAEITDLLEQEERDGDGSEETGVSRLLELPTPAADMMMKLYANTTFQVMANGAADRMKSAIGLGMLRAFALGYTYAQHRHEELRKKRVDGDGDIEKDGEAN